MAKGYIIGHVTIEDVEAYKVYGAANDTIVPEFEGRFLARGGQSKVVEGDLHQRHVIIEFPSFEKASAFYYSPAYQENMKIRQANSQGCILLLEGIEE